MKASYEKPKAAKLDFDYTNVVVASGGVAKNPGNHICTVMPNGKDLPENAVDLNGKNKPQGCANVP